MSADEEQRDCGVEFSLAEERDFQQVLNICSSDAFDGLDYMESTFHRWLQEPGRLVFLARMKDRVVALESALLVDAGQTVVFQGLRVAPDLRGRGIGGALQRHVTAHVRRHYPEVSAVRLSRGDRPSAQTLAKYRVVATEAILSLCCEASDLAAFVSELRSRLPPGSSPSSPPVTLTQQEAESLILSDHVISNLLPGGTVINDWEPLRPVASNMAVLRRRGLTWIVDRRGPEPSAVSLRTAPYAVPYRHDARHFNINIFGRGLSPVCVVFVAQLEALLPSARGFLVFHTYLDPAVWSGLRRFCHNDANVSFFKDYWEEVVLEKDL